MNVLRLLHVAAAMSLAALLGACGSSTDTRVSSYAAAHLHGDTIGTSTRAVKPFAGTGGNSSNDDNPSKADSGNFTEPEGVNPCALVTRTQAQAILGEELTTPQEAPLGPTCIYTPVHSRDSITLVIESASMAALRSQMRHDRPSTVSRRHAYCGEASGMITLVALASRRVLSVTAPSCAVGAHFASVALTRLSG